MQVISPSQQCWDQAIFPGLKRVFSVATGKCIQICSLFHFQATEFLVDFTKEVIEFGKRQFLLKTVLLKTDHTYDSPAENKSVFLNPRLKKKILWFMFHLQVCKLCTDKTYSLLLTLLGWITFPTTLRRRSVACCVRSADEETEGHLCELPSMKGSFLQTCSVLSFSTTPRGHLL